MSRYQVKKVVAVCFLEAAKTALDHLGQHRMDLSQRGVQGARELPAVYGDLRRLRDYLQRCISAFPEVVELEIAPEDQALLVASCRRAVDVLDHRAEGAQTLPEQERGWLRQKRQMIADWAVEMAAKPLVELPLPRFAATPSLGAKALGLRINQKLYGGSGPSIRPPAESAQAGPSGAPPMHPEHGGSGASMFGGLPGHMQHESTDPAASTQPPQRLRGVDPTAGNERDQEVAPPASGEPRTGSCFPLGMAGDEAGGDARQSGALFDSRQVRDPRLRSLAGLDLRAYERAIEARDFRLAAVHLSSVLEGAVVDYSLPRRVELGLAGTPDSWNPQEIVLQVLGDGCTPRDRSLLYHVFVARSLIRPATQLTSPTVVTVKSLERLAEFVCRALREMGFDARNEVSYSAAIAEAAGPQAPAQPAPDP